MKVIFNKDILLSALIPASTVAPSKNTIQSIEGVLFECTSETEGMCRLTAYDMEKGLRTSIDCDIIREGKYIINSQHILQIVRSLPDGDIMIEIDEKLRAKISGGTSSFEISVMSGENYPALPLLSGDRKYTLPQYILRDLIEKTAFSAAVNSSKAIFNGVNFKIENNVLRCVGCDSNRFGLAETDLESESSDADIIVPVKILNEILRMMHDSEDTVDIMIARKHVIFKIGEFTYFSRLIDGEYINYKRIIPDGYERVAYINKNTIKSATERATIVTEDKLGGNRAKTHIKLEFEKDELKISSVSSGGSINETIPVSMTGEPLAIGFNCRFLVEALSQCDDAETVCFKMNGPLTGMSIEKADGGDDKEEAKVRYMFFVAPSRMNGR